MLEQRLNYAWRLFATNLCFLTFGLGAWMFVILLFPAFHFSACVASLGLGWAHRRCQYIIHLGFRLFIWMLWATGILTYEVQGREKLQQLKGTLIVANHPTLLDVVFLISMIPQSQCVVKQAAWSNPFLIGVMWGAGYIQNEDPFQLVEDCVRHLDEGSNLVIFPEATRTVRGRPMHLKRGAATIISMTKRPVVPISISCSQPTLSKADKWYLPAPEKFHMRLVVHDNYDPMLDIVDTGQLSLSNRRINRALQKLFTDGMTAHG